MVNSVGAGIQVDSTNLQDYFQSHFSFWRRGGSSRHQTRSVEKSVAVGMLLSFGFGNTGGGCRCLVFTA
jgi:hypothetical protein